MKQRFNLYKMQKHELKDLRGGNTCGCSCWAVNTGGSTKINNGEKNLEGNKFSDRGNITLFVSPPEEYWYEN